MGLKITGQFTQSGQTKVNDPSGGNWYESDAIVVMDSSIGSVGQEPDPVLSTNTFSSSGSTTTISTAFPMLNGQCLETPASSSFRFVVDGATDPVLDGTSDYTIEFFARVQANVLFYENQTKPTVDVNDRIVVGTTDADNFRVWNNNQEPRITETGCFVQNAIHHYAITANDTTGEWVFYRDGVSITTATWSIVNSTLQNSQGLTTGSSTVHFDRYQIVPRLLYTGNFTPPTPS